MNSGQVFLWQKIGTHWYGIYGTHVVKFLPGKREFELESFPEMESCSRRIFRLDDDFRQIFGQITRDPLIHRLVGMYPGLRLIRQDPEQCLFSFLCASNTNIPMIRRMLYNITRKLGASIKVDGLEFHTFPSARTIARTSVADLKSCGLGYRAKAVKDAAIRLNDGSLNLAELKQNSYEDAKKQLLLVYGIGNKIADCILLFSLDKLEAFPIDVWISRAIARHYRWMYGGKNVERQSPQQYDVIARKARTYFGKYAGYAQQYLYYQMRAEAGVKW